MPRFPAPPRTPWQNNFPAVIGHAEYRSMRDDARYAAAKAGVSNEDALSLAMDLISDAAVDEIKQQIDGTTPRILAVHAIEASGRNKIPMAYAEALAHILDLPTDPGIVQSSIANHGGAQSIYHRMVSQPSFDGYVEPDTDYYIVDDTCTAGGTLANLKGFIESNGGNVVAMSVLARRNVASPYYISLASTTFNQLIYRHRGLDAFWKDEFGYGLEALTEGEAGHLYAAPSVDTIRNRLTEARRDLYGDGDEETNCSKAKTSDQSNDQAHDSGGNGTRC